MPITLPDRRRRSARAAARRSGAADHRGDDRGRGAAARRAARDSGRARQRRPAQRAGAAGEGSRWREVEVLRTLRNHLLQIRPVLQRRDRQRRDAPQQRGRRGSIRLFAARFDPAFQGQRARRSSRRATRRCAARSRRCRQPVRRRDPARARRIWCGRRCAPTPISGPSGPCSRSRSRARKVDGMVVAAPDLRDLRALAAARRHPPARRQGRARRHPLERSPRRLPHRDPRPDEDADGQERHHRPGRRRRAASCSRASCRRVRRSTPT